MSVTNTSVYVEQAGNGVKVAFDFAFKILASTDLVVKKKAADGTYGAALTLNVDYTVAFDSTAETGTVTYTVAPVNGGASNIDRATALTQATSLPREGAMPAKSIETMVDKVTLAVQELTERVSRAPLQPIVPPAPGALTIAAPADRRAMIYSSAGGGLFNIVPSTYDPDTLQAAAAASATAAAASAASASGSASSATASAAAASASAAAAAASAATLAASESSGTLAARPAAPASIMYYYATDDGSYSKYVPSAARWFLLG